MSFTISVQELKQKMDRGEKFVLLDVREDWEYNLANIPNSTLIPLGTLPQSLQKLDPNAEIVAYCHKGMRSADAINFLYQNGYKNVKNLVGGIEAWSLQIDPNVPRYR